MDHEASNALVAVVQFYSAALATAHQENVALKAALQNASQRLKGRPKGRPAEDALLSALKDVLPTEVSINDSKGSTGRIRDLLQKFHHEKDHPHGVDRVGPPGDFMGEGPIREDG